MTHLRDEPDSLIVYTTIVYTAGVTDEIEGFAWDAANIDNIMQHAVAPFEVEEVLGLPHVTIPGKTIEGEKRWKLLGRTASNRHIVVVFAVRRNLSAP
jgi:uncharacterized DUF497 family protein